MSDRDEIETTIDTLNALTWAGPGETALALEALRALIPAVEALEPIPSNADLARRAALAAHRFEMLLNEGQTLYLPPDWG